MINGNVTEFIDKLYYGGEMLFEYHGRTYFIQGWTEDSISKMVLDEFKETPFEKYIWRYESYSMIECAEAFLNATIFDGKTFAQVEREIIWKD